MNKRIPFSLLSVGALALVACGSDDPVAVDQPWARATSAAQPNGAVYMELTADHDDVLVGASVSSDISDHAEIHEVIEADGSGDMADMDSEDDMGDMESSEDMDSDEDMGDMDMGDGDGDHGGMAPGMIMQEVPGGLELVADETVVFEPGGYHVMLLDLVEPLEVGDEFELTLEFADNDDVTITVPVEETAP